MSSPWEIGWEDVKKCGPSPAKDDVVLGDGSNLYGSAATIGIDPTTDLRRNHLNMANCGKQNQPCQV